MRKSFNRAFVSYDQASTLQKKTASTLIDLISSYQERFTAIVDMACGTGNCTQVVASAFNCDKLYALDFSEKSLLTAREKTYTKKVTFVLADFDFPVFKASSIDLLVSNMGMQWSKSLLDLLNTFFRYLVKGGLLAFSVPLLGTFPELKPCCRNHFFCFDEILNLLKINGFQLLLSIRREFIECFETSFSAVKSLKLTGANVLLSTVSDRRGLSSKRGIDRFFESDKNVSLSYHIGFFIVRKN